MWKQSSNFGNILHYFTIKSLNYDYQRERNETNNVNFSKCTVTKIYRLIIETSQNLLHSKWVFGFNIWETGTSQISNQKFNRNSKIDQTRNISPYYSNPQLKNYTRAGVTSSLNFSIGRYAGGMKREPLILKSNTKNPPEPRASERKSGWRHGW